MIKAFALTGRIAKCYLIPRVLPWAGASALQGVLLNRNLRRYFVTFGDISVIFGDNFVIFGDIIPYPDFEAKQPVRRSYLPHTY